MRPSLVLSGLLALAPALAAAAAEGEPVPVIFDTDMDTDCDDVGALAVLHALAGRGELEVLATVVSSKYPYAAPCTAAVNRYYGRGELPVGAPKGAGAPVNRGSRYAKPIAEEFPSPYATNDDAPDAVAVYRDALAGAADGSVVVVTVGYLTNLADLLASGPDDRSPLGGKDLVEKKVRLWVCMGGTHPANPDPVVNGNLKPDPKSAAIAVAQWPTPVVFSGIGRGVMTGGTLGHTPAANPVRRAYKLHLGNNPTRPSWDQAALLYAVRPHADLWREGRGGYNHVFPNGTTEWRPEPANDRHRWVKLKPGREPELTALIDDLMAAPPAGSPDRRGADR